MHKVTEPSILYLGTPVVLISTRNEDESTNVAPMSSAWWLGWSCIMSFAQFYGLGDRVQPSRLAEIPEESYRPFAAMSR
jgi:hypothetical protein